MPDGKAEQGSGADIGGVNGCPLSRILDIHDSTRGEVELDNEEVVAVCRKCAYNTWTVSVRRREGGRLSLRYEASPCRCLGAVLVAVQMGLGEMESFDGGMER